VPFVGLIAIYFKPVGAEDIIPKIKIVKDVYWTSYQG
jgi:hypothetical protein